MSNFNNLNNSTIPVSMQAMNPQEYRNAVVGQMQDRVLHDPNQIAAELANDREVRLDTAKLNNNLILERGKTEMKKEVIKYSGGAESGGRLI